MQSVQSSPSDTFSAFLFFHSICHQIFHGMGIYRFRFPQFSKGCFMVKVIAAISSRYYWSLSIDAWLGS